MRISISVIMFALLSVITCNAQEDAVPLHVKRLLVLGVGGEHGAEYKIKVLQELRPHADHIDICDTGLNSVVQYIEKERLADGFFVVNNDDPVICAQSIIKILDKNLPDVVFTVREEWLQTAACVAQTLGLAYQDLNAYQRSQNKYAMRCCLKEAGIDSLR